MRILYMGTPEIAATVLSCLLQGPFPLVGAVCQPDKPQGRGMQPAIPPVKRVSLAAGLPVVQPETLKGGAMLPVLREWRPDIIVVVAYGRILPPYILDFPKYGCVNLHASLLPRYRGAAPVQRAVMAGETVTGLSAMVLSPGMDEGDIIDVCEIPVEADETAGALFERMAHLGGPFLTEILQKIDAGTVTAVPQDHEKATYAPPLLPAEGKLPLEKPARAVFDHFRGVSPKPGAFLLLNEKKIKIFSLRVLPEGAPRGAAPGEVFLPGKGRLAVAAGGQTALELLELAPEGKRRMDAQSFLNGRGVASGAYFL